MGLPATRTSAKFRIVVPIGDYGLIGIGTDTTTLIAEGLVSHNIPPFPDLDCWHLGFTQEEIDSNWRAIKDKEAILLKALELGIPPEPDCDDWEWKYCENIEHCTDTACYRKKTIRGRK